MQEAPGDSLQVLLSHLWGRGGSNYEQRKRPDYTPDEEAEKAGP